MSQVALKALSKVVEDLREKVTWCAWCGKLCANGDHLYAHISLRHIHPPVRFTGTDFSE